MNKEDEVIEILDDFEDTITIPPINKNTGVQFNLSENEVSSQPAPIPQEVKISNNFGVNHVEEQKVEPQIYAEVKNLEDVNYSPIEPEKEEMNIEMNISEENTKSGLGFVIVLFILLIAFVIALPYISKLF